MTHTYHGTKVSHDWMPVALANGVEDAEKMPRFDRSNLYRWSAPLSRILYRIGRWLGAAGMEVNGGGGWSLRRARWRPLIPRVRLFRSLHRQTWRNRRWHGGTLRTVVSNLKLATWLRPS